MKSLFLTFSLTLIMGAGSLAYAEEQSDNESSGDPSSVIATDTSNSEIASATEKTNGWELCPEPQKALADVPASAEQLQADIDRYTLCLDRAQLLTKLEELKKGPESAMVNPMALPGSVAPVPLTEDQTSELINDAPSLSSDKEAAEEAAPAKPLVQDISGANGRLVARITDTDGNIETVKTGDTLSDGSVVSSITATQVSVRKDGKAERLEWGK